MRWIEMQNPGAAPIRTEHDQFANFDWLAAFKILLKTLEAFPEARTAVLDKFEAIYFGRDPDCRPAPPQSAAPAPSPTPPRHRKLRARMARHASRPGNRSHRVFRVRRSRRNEPEPSPES